MKKLGGVTLVEILMVMGILMLLMGTIWLVAAPAMQKKSKEAVCMANMKQITSAVKLYGNDNDDRLPLSWSAAPVKPYLKADPDSLNCPLASTFLDKKRWGYQYEVDLNSSMQNLIKTKDLGDGRSAPDFDETKDALFKCTHHFTNGYLPQGSFPYVSTGTLKLNVLTAYPDMSVRYAPQLPCWEIPIIPKNLVETAIAHCDGQILGK